MDYYSDSCDQTNNIKSKRKHLQILTHNEFEKTIRKRRTTKNTDLCEIDSIFEAYIINHKKKFALNLFTYDFTLVFNKKLTPHIESELQNNITIFPLEKI